MAADDRTGSCSRSPFPKQLFDTVFMNEFANHTRSGSELKSRRLTCEIPSRSGNTASMNDVEPQTWIADVLTQLPGSTASRVLDLPRNWKSP